MEQQSFAIRETPVVRIKCSGCVTTALSTSVHDVSSSKNAIVFTERLPQQLRLSFFQPSTLQRKLILQPAVPFPFALRVVDSDTSIWWSALQQILSLSRMDLNSYCLPNRASHVAVVRSISVSFLWPGFSGSEDSFSLCRNFTLFNLQYCSLPS